jgi:hypothetical protein
MKNDYLFVGPIPDPEKIHISVNKINFFDIEEEIFKIMDWCVDDWARFRINPDFEYARGSRLSEDQWNMFMSDVYAMYDFRYRRRVTKPQKKESNEQAE